MTVTTPPGTTPPGATPPGTTTPGVSSRPDATPAESTPSPDATLDGAARPRIDPRIRERRIEVQRALGRRRLRVLLVVGSVVVAAGCAFLAVNSPLMDVDRVVVVGAQHETAAAIRAASRVHRHDALLFVDDASAARRVEQLPWVSHATVRRELPDTIRIVVSEYTPTAYVRDGANMVLLAGNGRAITRVPFGSAAGGMEIRGVRRPPAAGELLSPPEAAAIAPQLPPALVQQVAAVDVSGPGVELVLTRNERIRFGAPTDIAAKGAAALAVLAQNGNAPFRYIDVSTPDAPVMHVD